MIESNELNLDNDEEKDLIACSNSSKSRKRPSKKRNQFEPKEKKAFIDSKNFINKGNLVNLND